MSKQILLSNTSGSASLGMINSNFTELYDNQVTPTNTIALTNKMIDGDTNTVQDLPYTALKSTARSGLDITVVTGTKGSNNELVKWNSDGDAVSAGVSTETTLTSDSDLKVPTSAAVANYTASQIGVSKTMFVPVSGNATIATLPPYDSLVGTFPVNTIDNNQDVFFMTRIPDNFTNLTGMVVAMIPDTTEGIQWDVFVNYGQVGEAYNNHTNSVLNATQNVTQNFITEVSISSVFTNLSARDYIGIQFNSNISSLRILGLYITYT